MGKGDYRWREQKKQKKEAKKVLTTAIVQPPLVVEVVKAKGKKEKPLEEE